MSQQTIANPKEQKQEQEQDSFQINLDNPGMEPCCFDNCNRLPTFSVKLMLEYSTLEVFMCQKDFELSNKFRLMHMRQSRIIKNWLERLRLIK